MRYQEGESYESWAERVHKFEYGYALQRIAKGDALDVVLEQLSKRMTEKLMYPIRLALKDVDKTYDAVESRKRYEDAYLKKQTLGN